MADADKTKVFISWSGDTSKAVALALRDWLPDLFDTVLPWASDIDIAAGQKGLPQIEQTLAGSRFGIIVVTQENQNAPWLNFEAGALSKVITTDTEQRVAPLLVDLTSPTQLTGPMSQFQANVLDKAGLTRVLQSLGEVVGVLPDVVTRRVHLSWPQLEEQIQLARDAARTKPQAPKRTAEDMLEEVLTTVRELKRENDEGPRVVPTRLGSGITATSNPAKRWLSNRDLMEYEEQFATEAHYLAKNAGVTFGGISRDKSDPENVVTSIHIGESSPRQARDYLLGLRNRYPEKTIEVILSGGQDDPPEQ